jgi:hypothetical protein
MAGDGNAGDRVLFSGFSPAAGRRGTWFDRRGNDEVSFKNSKSQITNNKKITMTKIQNHKPVWVIGY